jgi:uncharacterized protein YaaQ
MKLLIVVVNRDDTYSLVDALSDAEHRATVISTTGGFLGQGNSMLLDGAVVFALDVERFVKF